MFINAICFGVEENVRKVLKYNSINTNNNTNHLANTNSAHSFEHYKFYLISGAIAGFAQSFLLTPVELIKLKMQIPKNRQLK